MNNTDGKPVVEPAGSDGHRDLQDGELILEVDEFWDKDSGKFVPLHACASISARWMVGTPYSSNFFVRARRPITPSPNADLTDAARPGAGNNQNASAGGAR